VGGMPLQVSMVHGGGGGEEVGEVFLLSSYKNIFNHFEQQQHLKVANKLHVHKLCV
jgi:hypothetical protein